MDDEISVPISLPLDNDGFLRRECPTCEKQFKWYAHPEGDPDAEPVDQYFCPLCGAPSGADAWWTPAQLEYAQGAAAPALEEHVQEMLRDAFNRIKDVTFTPDPHFSLEIATPDPITEQDDMVIVEPPCHPNEPLKVPDSALGGHLHCLVCGSAFSV